MRWADPPVRSPPPALTLPCAALYGYGLSSQMLFGEGFEEPLLADCTARESLCWGPFPSQWSVIGGRAKLTAAKTEVFTGKQSLEVDGAAQLLNAGLHRLGIAAAQGWSYEGSFFYKDSDPPTGARPRGLSKVSKSIEVLLVLLLLLADYPPRVSRRSP